MFKTFVRVLDGGIILAQYQRRNRYYFAAFTPREWAATFLPSDRNRRSWLLRVGPFSFWSI